jgi:hypothetical protein
MVDKISINPQYSGPTILELDAVVADIQGAVEVRWQGTKAEYAALDRHPKRTFILHVQDLPAYDSAATRLGLRYVFDAALLANAFTALTSRKAYNWRSFVDGVGTAVTRSLITRISAGAIRKGKTPRLAIIASECLIESVNPIDADVLLRLRVLRGD